MKTFRTALLALAVLGILLSTTAGAFAYEDPINAYEDPINGYVIRIPAEFKMNNKGQTTDWVGPILHGMAVEIYVSAAPMPGVPSQTLYDTNLRALRKGGEVGLSGGVRVHMTPEGYRDDDIYGHVGTKKVRCGKEVVPAFFVWESNLRRGTTDSKTAEDIHRGHMVVFGNDRIYTLTISGSWYSEAFMQRVFRNVEHSFQLIPIE